VNDGIFESTYLLYAAEAALTPAATRQDGSKFRRDHLLHLSVCIAPTGEERDELLWCVNPVHVEGEKTAVLDAEVAAIVRLNKMLADKNLSTFPYLLSLLYSVDNLTLLYSAKHGCRPKVTQDGGRQRLTKFRYILSLPSSGRRRG